MADATDPAEDALVAFAKGAHKNGLTKYLIDAHGQQLLVDLLVEELGGHKAKVALVVRWIVAPLIKRAAEAESAVLRTASAKALATVRNVDVVRRALDRLAILADRLAALADEKNARSQAEKAFAAYLKGTRPELDKETLDLLSADLLADQQQLTLLGEIHDLVTALPDRLTGQPPLRHKIEPDAGEQARFVFTARRSTFVGRDDALEAIRNFLETDAPLSWWLITGPGGMGKSRLAQEALLANGDWRMGFLADTKRAKNFDWESWTPTADTCVIVDYAARDPEHLRATLCALADRAAGLPYRVRFLLLERAATEDEPWWTTFQGSASSDGATVQARQYAPPLLLPAPGQNDLWAVMSERWRRSGTTTPAQEEALSALARLDTERRPLFALILADAFTHDGETAWSLSKEDAVQGVLDREAARFWPRDRTDALDNLFCLATMTGGLSAEAWADVQTAAPDLVPPVREGTACTVARMAGQGGAEGRLPPLQPDILGEFAVLYLLNGDFNFTRRRALTAIAWMVDCRGIAAFLNRCINDFPANPGLLDFLTLPHPTSSQERQFWIRLSCRYIIANAVTRPQDSHLLANTMRETASTHPNESALHEPAWVAAISVAGARAKRGEPKVALNLLEDLMQGVNSANLREGAALVAGVIWQVAETNNEPEVAEKAFSIFMEMAPGAPHNQALRKIYERLKAATE